MISGSLNKDSTANNCRGCFPEEGPLEYNLVLPIGLVAVVALVGAALVKALCELESRFSFDDQGCGRCRRLESDSAPLLLEVH
jgi:hypothetical protein